MANRTGHRRSPGAVTVRNRPLLFLTLALSAALPVLGCSTSTNPASTDFPKPAQKASQTVKLDAKMMSGIQIEALKENSIPSYLMASGKVQFNEDQLANVVPP